MPARDSSYRVEPVTRLPSQDFHPRNGFFQKFGNFKILKKKKKGKKVLSSAPSTPNNPSTLPPVSQSSHLATV